MLGVGNCTFSKPSETADVWMDKDASCIHCWL